MADTGVNVTSSVVVAHPLTVGPNGQPRYTADDFRKTNNVFYPPVLRGQPFKCIQGIQNTLDGPVCYLTGTTLHVVAHSGYLCPVNAESPYTYWIDDTSFTLPSLKQDWKIAITVTDPSVGKDDDGKTPAGNLTYYPMDTLDSDIPGLVLATVTSGAVNDVVPRFQTGTVLIVPTLSQLTAIYATNGQKAKVSDSGVEYVMDNGSWVPNEAQYEIAWTSTWSGLSGMEGHWYDEIKSKLVVKGINGAKGAWYQLDIGARVGGTGEYGLTLRMDGSAYGGGLYQYNLLSPAKNAGAENFTLSKRVFMVNGTYDVLAQSIRYANASINGDSANWSFYDPYLSPDGKPFYRYITLVKLP